MNIVVDVHERRSGVPDALRGLGWEVRFKALPTGDYAIDDLALIERKTTRLGSLRNVLLAEPDELRRIPGIGLQRARAIHELATSTSDSGVSRNCGIPST